MPPNYLVKQTCSQFRTPVNSWAYQPCHLHNNELVMSCYEGGFWVLGLYRWKNYCIFLRSLIFALFCKCTTKNCFFLKIAIYKLFLKKTRGTSLVALFTLIYLFTTVLSELCDNSQWRGRVTVLDICLCVCARTCRSFGLFPIHTRVWLRL